VITGGLQEITANYRQFLYICQHT